MALLLIAMIAGGWLTAEHTIWVPEVTRGTGAWRAPAASDSIPTSIAEAEAEGRRYPRSSEPHAFNPRLTSPENPGSAERRCIRADTSFASQSGDFYTGNVGNWAEYWRAGHRNVTKIHWHAAYRPLHVPMQLTLRVARIDSAGPQRVYVSETRKTQRVVREAQRYGAVWVTNEIDLPTRGTWMFIATARHAWGCFLVEL